MNAYMRMESRQWFNFVVRALYSDTGDDTHSRVMGIKIV